MEPVELIKRGYCALGLGADDDVLAMFDQLGTDPAHWVVRDLNDTRADMPSREVTALELFGRLPPQYEVIGVSPEGWHYDERHSVLVVTGHYRTRPRGTWEVLSLPFEHIWSIVEGRVESVVSYLDGIELRRLGPDGSVRRLRRRWWRRRAV